MKAIRRAATRELSTAELRALRGLLDASFHDGFTDDDWDHTVGGFHVLVVDDGDFVAHAAVVERALIAGDRQLRTGYVEGVATSPEHRRRGHGSKVMREANAIIATHYDIGALSTGLPGFYAHLGWEQWRGPTYVSSPEGRLRTEEDDDGVMVLLTDVTRALDRALPLVCDWRRGDVW